MKNIIGKIKRHKNGYEYLSISLFPSDKIKLLITDKLLQKSNKAQFLLGKLSGITLLLPDVDFFIHSYVMKDATSSSQIEGTKATIVDAFEYFADGTNLNTDADDIVHYVEALNYGLKKLKQEDFPFTLRFIRDLHQKLMHKARQTHFSDPGEFRKSQNWIGGTRPDNASFVPPSPDEISENLKDLEKFIHTPYIHPIIDSALLHAQFETIHPFLDGNGRTGRLLITFYLIHHKYLDLPTLFLSTYFKKHQKVYYERLQQYHDGNIAPWIEFFVDAVIETATDAIEISKKITKQRDIDLEALGTLSSKTREIAIPVVRELYKDTIVTSTTIGVWIQQTKPGTLKFINNLVKVGILKLHKKGEGTRPALYVHDKYLKIFIEN